MKISKKLLPELFEQIKSGEKTFELRLADFECKQGDSLVLKEWDPKTKSYTGRELEKQVTFVLNTKIMETYHSKEELKKHGLIVIAIK